MTQINVAIPAIRAAIKAAGFKAKVSQVPGYATQALRVTVPTFDARFAPDQIATFCAAALAAGLTGVQGTAIDVAHEALLTGKMQWNFWA